MVSLFSFQKEPVAKMLSALYTTQERKPVVLAGGPGTGKTRMSICGINDFLRRHPTAKVLVLTHGTVVLRRRYCQEIEDCKNQISFSHHEVEKGSELKQFYNQKQVFVVIPQTLKNIKNLPHFDLLVVDEAHHFYLARKKGTAKAKIPEDWLDDASPRYSDPDAGLVMAITKEVRPDYQLLLTGTPSPFNLERDKYTIIYIPMGEILEAPDTTITDIIVDLASTSYSFTEKDFNDQDELKFSYAFKKEETEKALDDLLRRIHYRLTAINKNYPLQYRYPTIVPEWMSALHYLDKTMIACRNKRQAIQVRDYFRKRNIDVAISLSKDDSKGDLDPTDTDPDSKEITRFLEDDSCRVLVVVRRGILGFNFTKLANVVDMTGSRNPDTIFQLMCRAVRKDGNKKKLFFKVVPYYLANYMRHVMQAVLCLTQREWFESFNGRNFLDMDIPVKLRAPRVRSEPDDKKIPITRAKRGQKFDLYDMIGVPTIALMNDIRHRDSHHLNRYATTTLREVRKRLKLEENDALQEMIQKAEELYKEHGYLPAAKFLPPRMPYFIRAYPEHFEHIPMVTKFKVRSRS